LNARAAYRGAVSSNQINSDALAEQTPGQNVSAMASSLREHWNVLPGGSTLHKRPSAQALVSQDKRKHREHLQETFTLERRAYFGLLQLQRRFMQLTVSFLEATQDSQHSLKQVGSLDHLEL
jgi:hypothetical protein